MNLRTATTRFAALNLDPALAEAAEAVTGDALLEGILRLQDAGVIPAGFVVVSRFDRICTGRFRAAATWAIRSHPNVMSFKIARPLGVNSPTTSSEASALPRPRWSNGSAAAEPLPYSGRGVVVAALDFGLDFAHPNFLDHQGRTRLIGFWHQGAAYDARHPNRFGYGRIFSRVEINTALLASDPYRVLGYHPAISDAGLGSHATHTFDIAAGNGRAHGAVPGLGSSAELVFVHLSTPGLGTFGNLGDSVRLLEALDFVEGCAAGRPCAINVSVGSMTGPHDGTSLVEQGMHEFLLKVPGMAISQSAGNYHASDLAVHGRLADGGSRDLHWIIDPADTTGNQMDAWYSGKDRLRVAIKAPDNDDFVEVELGQMATLAHEGRTIGRIYHRRHDPNNHDHHVEVFLERTAPAGTWTVRLIGEFVIDGTFHAWIQRDLARPGAQSRFDHRNASARCTLGSIASSPLVITVGAYDPNLEDRPPAPFSSTGPTRDGRPKPELLAPGVDIVAARSIPFGATRQEGLVVARSGTSMAAPHVTGTIAAMFEAAGGPVPIDMIRACLQSTAEPFTTPEHADRAAWGRLDSVRAIQAILAWKEETDRQRDRRTSLGSQNGTALEAAESTELAAPSERAVQKGGTMNRILDSIERLIPRGAHDPRLSETLFLGHLLRNLGADSSHVQMTPAQLFSAFVKDGGLALRLDEVLEMLSTPGGRLLGGLQPGDLIVRRIPGSDVGHLAIAATSKLLTETALMDAGIDAESIQPGCYAVVVEAGAFPHDRRHPFARRVLDRRGHLLIHNLLLRPRWRSREEAPRGLSDRVHATAAFDASPDLRVFRVGKRLKTADAVGHVQLSPEKYNQPFEDGGSEEPDAELRSLDYEEDDEGEAERIFAGVEKVQDQSYDGEAPYYEEQISGASNLRDHIRAAALKEWDTWGRGTHTEAEDEMVPVLRKYWRVVRPANQVDDAIKNRDPWSAAFVSWVMQEAGAGAAFHYGAAHRTYVAAAKYSRQQRDSSKFWAHSVDEVVPEVGDVLCRDRQRENGRCAGTTFDNVDKGDWPTHGDIVTDVFSDYINVIGGNVGGPNCRKGSGCTVNQRRVKVDARGLVLPNQHTCEYFAIVKVPDEPAQFVAPAPGRSLPDSLLEVIRKGLVAAEAIALVIAGERDENKVTNAIFYSRHPELPSGYKIKTHEEGLQKEWLDIRERSVRPVLKTLQATEPGVSPSNQGLSPSSAGEGQSGTAEFQAPGWKSFRYRFTRDDVEWTARLVEGEAGGRYDADNIAVVWALVNRFMLFHEQLRDKTFAEFLRRYSTTLQPYLKNPDAIERAKATGHWVDLGGTFFHKGKEYPKVQTVRHVKLQKASWDELREGARMVAEQVLGGRIPSPIGLASDFDGTHIFLNQRLRQNGIDPRALKKRSPGEYRARWIEYTQGHAAKKKRIWIGPDWPNLDQMNHNVFYLHPRTQHLRPDAIRILPLSDRSVAPVTSVVP